MLAVGAFASACLIGLGVSLSARAMMVRPPAGPVKVAQADTVVVGRVMGLEDQDVTAPLPGTTNKVKYRIAVVRVHERIKGGKGKDTVRVGFLSPAPAVPPGGGVRVFIRRPASVNLAPGQDGIFYLTRHPTESFYVVPAFYSFTSSQAPNYAEELKGARKAVKLLQDPMAGLKSKDAKDRLLTAELLLGQYRTPKGGPVKTAPISAEESKLILSALLDADWTPRPVPFGQTTPQMLFYQLGATDKDGWRPPQNVRNPQEINNAMRAWLREHRDTFRIQRFVPAGEKASR
jgi:hypothetical protein